MASKNKSIKAILSDRNKFKMITEATFQNADINKNGFIELNELEILMKNVAKYMRIE